MCICYISIYVCGKTLTRKIDAIVQKLRQPSSQYNNLILRTVTMWCSSKFKSAHLIDTSCTLRILNIVFVCAPFITFTDLLPFALKLWTVCHHLIQLGQSDPYDPYPLKCNQSLQILLRKPELLTKTLFEIWYSFCFRSVLYLWTHLLFTNQNCTL